LLCARRGSEDPGSGLKAIFVVENGFNLSTGKLGQNSREFGRQAFVGLSNDQYGAVTLGRQYDSVVDYLGPLALNGTQNGGTLASHPYDNDNLNDSVLINKAVKSQSVDYGGFKVGALYGFSNAAGSFADNRAYGVGASYVFGGLKVAIAAGYLQLNGGGSSINSSGAVASGDSTFNAALNAPMARASTTAPNTPSK
jgi:GBP family porin